MDEKPKILTHEDYDSRRLTEADRKFLDAANDPEKMIPITSPAAVWQPPTNQLAGMALCKVAGQFLKKEIP